MVRLKRLLAVLAFVFAIITVVSLCHRKEKPRCRFRRTCVCLIIAYRGDKQARGVYKQRLQERVYNRRGNNRERAFACGSKRKAHEKSRVKRGRAHRINL